MSEQQGSSQEDGFASKESVSDEQNTQKTHYVEPDYIIIDDRALSRDGQSTHWNENKTGEEAQKAQGAPISLPLRFICFLGLVFCTIFGLGIFVLSALLTLLSTITLFQNRKWSKGAFKFWKIFVHTAVAGFSFLLGILNPTLGLGLLGLYFSLSGELVDSDILRKIIKASFGKL